MKKGLCEICSPKQWKTVSTDMLISDGYPVYGANGVIGFYSEYNHKEETLLITCRGATCGSLNICEPYSYVNGNAMALDNLSNDIDIMYLYYFLQNRGFADVITGSAQPQIVRQSLEKVVITYPELEKQKEIVFIINKVDKLIALRKKQLAKLDELVKARFVEMFGDIETNSRGLPILAWQEVFHTTTGKLDSNALVEGGKYPFFTCAKEHYWIDTYAFDCEALLLAGNNAAGVYDVKYYKGRFNAYQRTYVLRLKNNDWSYKLFKRQLEDKLQYLQSQSKGSNTRYLTLGILNELRFIIPPIDEQEKFTSFVKQTEKKKLTIQQSLDKLKLLKKALMQEYFG